jgi:hypothetical protein
MLAVPRWVIVMIGKNLENSWKSKYISTAKWIELKNSENRSKMLKFFNEKYKDLKILSGTMTPDFLIFSPSEQKFITGTFSELPAIEHVSERSEDEKFRNALDRFANTAKYFIEYLQLEDSDIYKFRKYNFDDHDTIRRGFRYCEYDSRRISGCRLEIDNDCIWASSIGGLEPIENLRQVLESRWYRSDEISGRRIFEIKLTIDLKGYCETHIAEFNSIFLGGPQMSGKAKVYFSESVVDPLFNFICRLPSFQGDICEFLDHLDSIELNDNISM